MKRAHGQMSESLLLGAMLAMAGGFFDAYTYLCRGKVFANAQTGNIVPVSYTHLPYKMTESLQFGLVILAKLWYTNSNLKGWEDKNYGKTYYWRYRFR